MSEVAVIATVASGFVAFVVVLAIALKASERKDVQRLLDRRPISYTRVDTHDEWEAETADGRRFRSDRYGIIWYSFPDGYRTDLDREDELEEGLKRHKLLEKWTGPC
jgi:hypothetical protein